jgi:hypothetical protein
LILQMSWSPAFESRRTGFPPAREWLPFIQYSREARTFGRGAHTLRFGSIPPTTDKFARGRWNTP